MLFRSAVDVCMTRITMDSRPRLDDVAGYTSVLTEEERSMVRSVIQTPQPASVINDVHTWLSHRAAKVITELCRDRSIVPHEIDVVGFHGQTVWHEPREHTVVGLPLRATLQLGSGATLAALLGCAVVSDFRSADVALGGQGAPLVPRFDVDFLASPNENVIALKIGRAHV